MSPASNPAQAKEARSDRQLTALMAYAFCLPLRVVGKSDSSLSSYAVFWSVAAREGRTQVEVARDTGLSAKTVSRVIAHLGVTRNGLGWIRQVPDEDDRRLRRLYLSRKGKSLITRLLKELRKKGSAASQG